MDQGQAHAQCLDGRISTELRESSGPVAEIRHRALSHLDGHERLAVLLWRMPEGSVSTKRCLKEDAVEYLQCAGSAEGMTVEARRRGPAGFEHYAVGRQSERSEPDSPVVISWSAYQTTVKSHEVFNAEQAAPVFIAYHQTGWHGEYRPLPGWPQNGVVPAWSYQWLVATPDVAGSWVLPLDMQCRGPTAKSATDVALEQIVDVRKAQSANAPRPVVTLDSGYDLETLAHAKVDADLLVRLAKKRVMYRAPERHPGRGRPRLHTEAFRLADEDTYGQPDAPFSVIRVQVERLPNKKLPPRALWLAWIGGSLPAHLSVLWRWYLRRFTLEHAFRFFKQTLGWTTVRPRNPEAVDRWSWLVAAACWELWLTRPLVSEVRLPWEHARPDGLLTPGQVHRHFTGILVRVGTPARVPRKRGKSPGRLTGQRPKPPLHYQVARRAPLRAA